MVHVSKIKLFFVMAVCAVGILFSLPNILPPHILSQLPGFMQNTINLGLELRGGSHLQLEVDLKTAQQDYMANILDTLRGQLRKGKIKYHQLVVTHQNDAPSISLALKEPNQFDALKKIISKTDDRLSVDQKDQEKIIVFLKDPELAKLNKSIIERSIEVVRRRIDESGTKEPNLQRQGENRIIVQLPGVDDPAIVKERIGTTAKLEFRLVNHDAGPVSVSESGKVEARVPSGSELLPVLAKSKDGKEQVVDYLVIYKNLIVSGDALIDAQATIDHSHGSPIVSIEFNSVGARKFGDASTNNVGKQMAMVLDNKIISAPKFNEPIPNGRCVISGNFTVEEANNLALLLRAGALPAPLKVIEERTVGPSLGSDSIKYGQQATILAFILVAAFMILNYSLFGVFADIALAFNLILLFAALSLLQATLTLPGIAAIALTIGMAVDANVLIYERIKEELRNGARAISAVEAGYSRAMTTIVDSNLTTLIGAAILFEFGSGPIRGFAVNLALGIIISLFTALSLTKVTILYWIKWRKPKTLSI